jgi:hypothetical protein
MPKYLLFVIIFYSVSGIDISPPYVLFKCMILLYEIVIGYLKRELAVRIEAGARETASVPVVRRPDQQS